MITLPNGFDAAQAEAFARDGWWCGETLADVIDRAALERPDHPALVGEFGALTYADLRSSASRFAVGLRRLGVSKGDVVAVQLQNIPEFVIAYIGTGLCGAVLQTVHMPYRAAEVENLLAHSGAKAVIAFAQVNDYAAAAMMVTLKSRLPSLEVVISVGGAAEGAVPFETLLAGEFEEALARPDPADTFVLLYTSGTTGSPMGVEAIYQSYISNAQVCVPVLELVWESRVLCAAPFTHLYGQFALNVSLCAGATGILLPAFTPEALMSHLARYRPTALFSAPAHLQSCFEQNLVLPELMASLRFTMISGSACPPDLARRTEEAMDGGRIMQLWGMSELQCGCLTRFSDPFAVRTSSVGRAAPGNELRVSDDKGCEIPPGEEGELQIRGASVFCGYLNNPEATKSAYREDGWFRTGDLAIMDPDGNVRITGRIKELINRGGVKFHPADVEMLINEHPSVSQSAIVPMPDPVLGEKACCFVVLEPGANVDLGGICEWLKAHQVAKLKWPERLEVLAELPVTPTRKIMKAELARRLARRCLDQNNANWHVSSSHN